MTNIQAFLLGLVQGLAEFLPVSSSGHTTLLQMLFGIAEAPEILNVLLHLGTLLVVLVVYRRRILNMIRHPFKSELKWLILATLPTVAAALTFKDKLEAAFGDVKYLGYCFIFTSFIMLVGEAVNRLRVKKHKPVRWYDALVMGCMQVLAILPGVSRSGSTISGGMITGLSRKRAVDFSFLMSIPAILGSAVLGAKDIYDMAEAANVGFGAQLSALVQQMGGALPLVIGVATAAVSGFLAIKLMLYIVRQFGLRWFAAYTFLLGAFLIARQVLMA
ncbi:MAG: undecaprenyl-diphosphate phosphatase [Clostridia bacterium]|nr:undecaprenyl-diphosphate phosphatase [Clostridia bacterium]